MRWSCGASNFRDLLTAVHFEDDLVRKPIAAEVHDDGKDKGNGQPLRAAEILSDQHNQAGQGSE